MIVRAALDRRNRTARAAAWPFREGRRNSRRDMLKESRNLLLPRRSPGIDARVKAACLRECEAEPRTRHRHRVQIR